MQLDPIRESAFEILDQCKGWLAEEEAQAIVDEIIGLLKGRNITYACAYKVLDATRETLGMMSQRIAL